MSTPGPGSVRGAVVTFDQLDSTNSEAMRRVAAGERGPLWILAHRQTAGRGRSGREWVSPRGNLAVSLIFMPQCLPAQVPQLSLIAGVAVHQALESLWPEGVAGRRLRLKWPNDLLIGQAKLGGILVESTRFSADLVAVIGIGINIAATPDILDRSVTSMAEHVPGPPAAEVLVSHIAARLDACLAEWSQPAGFDGLRRQWLARAGPIGEAMSVNTGAGAVAGTFAGLDTDGALLLCGANDRQLRFTFGDVTLNTTLKV